MCHRKAFHKNWSHHHAAKFRNHADHPAKKYWKEKFKALHRPPVNVKELDDKFVLYLYAPGLEKSNFLIATVDNTLSISVEIKEEDKTQWKRQEFWLSGFKRQFELSEKVDKFDISATYENGVLIVTLPKLEGFETSRQEIAIA